MFIQTEATPNPSTLKFLPGKVVLEQGTAEFRSAAEADASPLAARIFTVPGVTGVFFGYDFVTVTKDNAEWQHLKPAILGAIMEHFMSGAPVLHADVRAVSPSSASAAGQDDTIDHVRHALKQVIDPELGYNIVDLGLVYDVAVEEGGGVHITMTTTTPGCPATDYLKSGAGEAASGIPGVAFVDVKLTYDPRWTPDMMTSSAKAHLGIA